jgi:hypothetical protein
LPSSGSPRQWIDLRWWIVNYPVGEAAFAAYNNARIHTHAGVVSWFFRTVVRTSLSLAAGKDAENRESRRKGIDLSMLPLCCGSTQRRA